MTEGKVVTFYLMCLSMQACFSGEGGGGQHIHVPEVFNKSSLSPGESR
jgi:hypothetical protein